MFSSNFCRVAIALLGIPCLGMAAEALNPLPSVLRLRAEQGYHVQRRLAVTGTAGVSGMTVKWAGGNWFMALLSSTKAPAYIQMSALAASLQPGLYSGDLTLRSTTAAANNPQTIRVELEVLPRMNRYPVTVFRDSLGVIRSGEFGLPYTSSGATQPTDPSAAQVRSGETFVVARTSSNTIAANVYRPATRTWSSWQTSSGAIAGQPAVAAISPVLAFVVARDASGAYWILSFSPVTGFGPWVWLGGIFATDPTVASCGDGSFYIAGRDQWGSIWIKRWQTGSGTGWINAGGVYQGKPGVACGSDNAAYITARNLANVAHLARFEGLTVSPWYASTGIVAASDPEPVASGLGVIFVVSKDAAGTVWYRPFAEGTGSNWIQWVNTGQSATSVAPFANRGLLFIAGATATNDLVWYRSAPAGWTPAPGAVAGGALATPR